MSALPRVLNGLDVRKSAHHANGYATVMMHRPEDGAFIVATWWPSLRDRWEWGHYLDSRDAAEEEFEAASERNRRRS